MTWWHHFSSGSSGRRRGLHSQSPDCQENCMNNQKSASVWGWTPTTALLELDLCCCCGTLSALYFHTGTKCPFFLQFLSLWFPSPHSQFSTQVLGMWSREDVFFLLLLQADYCCIQGTSTSLWCHCSFTVTPPFPLLFTFNSSRSSKHKRLLFAGLQQTHNLFSLSLPPACCAFYV